jgi:PAS domain S-box-containing protein
VYINFSGLKFFDLPFDSFNSKKISTLFPSLDIETLDQYRETTFIYRDKHSKKHLLHVTIDAYDSKLGNLVLYFTSTTEKKEEQQSSLQGEYFKKRVTIFETFIDKINEGVLVFSSNGKLLYSNERASKKFKIRPRTLKKHTAWELITHFKGFEDWEQITSSLQKKPKYHFTYKKEDGYLSVELHQQKVDNIVYNMLLYSDISESTLDKQSIVEKSNQIDLFERNIPAAIFKLVVNEKSENYLTYVSGSFERLFGFKLSINDVGWQRSLNFHPEDVIAFCNTMYESLEHFSEFNYIGRLLIEGRTVWCEVNAVPSFHNNELTFDGIILDITQRKEADFEIKRKRAFNDSVLHNIPADVAVFDEQHRYLFLNIKGIANDELRHWLIGKTDYDYCDYRGLDYSIADKRRDYFNEAKEKKDQVDWIDIIKKGDKTIYMLRRFYPFYVDGVFVYMIGYGIDITELKMAQLHLSEAEKENELILKSALDAIVMIDKDHKITFWNPQAEAIFGWTSKEAIGKNLLRKILAKELEHYHSCKDFVQKNDSRNPEKRNEFLAIKKDGDELPIELTLVNINEKEHKIHYCLFIRDISYRKAKEFEIEKQNKALIKQNKELEQFNYIASHDLQEPLITLIGYSNLLKEEYNEMLDEEGQLFLEFISKSATRMRSLIAGLLEYTRISTSENLFLTDLNTLVQDCLSNLEDRISNTKAQIALSPLPTINCSPLYISSLFQNLLSNALKFTPKDKSPVISITYEERVNDWLFRVKDNGIGISKKSQSEIFVMFRRLHNQDDYTGYGIGLAHCKRIVELHNGELWLESNQDEGSTFLFTISKKI